MVPCCVTVRKRIASTSTDWSCRCYLQLRVKHSTAADHAGSNFVSESTRFDPTRAKGLAPQPWSFSLFMRNTQQTVGQTPKSWFNQFYALKAELPKLASGCCLCIHPHSEPSGVVLSHTNRVVAGVTVTEGSLVVCVPPQQAEIPRGRSIETPRSDW